MLNIRELRKDLNECATLIKETKAILREPHQPRRDGNTQSRLYHLKQKVTQLCCLRAHHRGKVHLRDGSLLEQEKLVSYVRSYYTVEAPTTESHSS